MSSLIQNDDMMESIDLAIENGWTLRPSGKSSFININHEKNIKLSDESHIIQSSDEITKGYPGGVTSVALIAMHLKDVNFVCLDFDFTEPELKEKVNIVLSRYAKGDHFCRIGNEHKLGQYWFQTNEPVRHRSVKNFDVITTEKRCNAIGYYKDTDKPYEWPYKNIWENTPDELPFISDELIESILKLVGDHYGISYSEKKPTNSRHDAVKEHIFNKMNQPGFLNIIQEIITSPEYISAIGERDFKSETKRMFSWAAEQTFENYNDISGLFNEDKKDLFDDFMVEQFPRVEKNSFIDIVYNATKRNQFTHNKKIAFFTALSITSWLLTFSTRFQGIAPNLMILFIAHSGSGKTTTARAAKELIKQFTELQKSYMGGDIRTEASLFSNLETAPNPYYIVDEFTKIMKSRNNKSSHTTNITEILCQLYSDYSDTDLHQIRLKNSSYGLCMGPKMNLMCFSTPEFWKVFDESDFSQGLGRRFLIINDNTVSFAKKNMNYDKDFFKDNEKQLINQFMNKFVYKFMMYGAKDVTQYNIIKGVDKKGEDVMWEDAACMLPFIDLKPTDEVDEYFKTKFVDKVNELKKRSLSSGNNLNLYVVNSMPEFVKKLAVIHAIGGRAIIEKNKKGFAYMPTRDKLEMVSVEWAEKMFYYYMVHGLSYDLENIYKKDVEADDIINTGNSLVEKLEENDIEEFMISHNIVKSYFRSNKLDRYEVINNLVSRGLIEIVSEKATKRGTKYRIVSEE